MYSSGERYREYIFKASSFEKMHNSQGRYVPGTNPPSPCNKTPLKSSQKALLRKQRHFPFSRPVGDLFVRSELDVFPLMTRIAKVPPDACLRGSGKRGLMNGTAQLKSNVYATAWSFPISRCKCGHDN